MSADPAGAPVPPATPGTTAARAQVARDLAHKCVALAIGSGDAETYRMLMELSAVYTRCAELLAAEGAVEDSPGSTR